MAFQLRDRRIAQIGVIGAGCIGPEIAIDFARALFRYRVPVVLIDSAEQALLAAKLRVARQIERQIALHQVERAEGETLLGLLSYATQLEKVKQSNLLIEAVTEDLPTKRRLYEQLEAVCRADALLLSTSAHFQPEALFSALRNPRRAAVARYAYLPDRNPSIELVAGPGTSGLVFDFLELFYELLGKAPVVVKSRYGHVTSLVLEALLLAGCLVVERGWATVNQVDAVCRAQLGHSLGPFATMNATGSTSAADVALGQYHLTVMPWLHSPRLIKEQLRADRPWSSFPADQEFKVSSPLLERLTAWMLGAYFTVVGEIMDARLVELIELDEAVALGLSIEPPLSLMNKIGLENALRIVERFAYENSGVKIAARLREQAALGRPWPIHGVQREDDDEIAVLTIRRIRQVNMLSTDVLRQLYDEILAIERDPRIRGVVIRGFGTRAFSSGADLAELAQLTTAEDAEMVARRGQTVMRAIERLQKPVVAALNGLTLGAGLELALACHVRIATRDLPVLAGHPAPKLGLMPGYGGTQRLPRVIDVGAACRLLRSGETLSSADALRLGLVREVVAADVLRDRAVELAADLASGRSQARPITEGPIPLPDKLPEVDLTGLSRTIDALICDAISEGAKGGLEHGLDYESCQWAKLVEMEDFLFGMQGRTPHVAS